MTGDPEKTIDQLLESRGEYGPFAEAVGRCAVDTGWREIADKLSDMRKQPANNAAQMARTFKAQLGLGIIAACQDKEDQAEIIEREFLQPLRDKKSEGTAQSRLLLTELAYLDQHVCDDVRFGIYDQIKAQCESDPWSPAIRDYLLAWKMWEKAEHRTRTSDRRIMRTGPRVYLIASAKGGVGKSVIATALLNYLVADRKESTVLIDLDSSGPSSQFCFDIPAVAKALPVIPKSASKNGGRWLYPTFLDICDAASGLEHSPLELKDLIRQSLLEIAVKKQNGDTKGDETKRATRAAVVLPDSLTFCSLLGDRALVESGRKWLLAGLRALMDAIAPPVDHHPSDDHRASYTNVIFDFGSGLYGTNDVFFRWLSRHYPCSLIVVSSPRATDFATCLYESTWLSAAGDFRWKTPVLNLVNMWPSNKCDCFLATVDGWASDWLGRAIDAGYGGPKQTSGAQIYSWRIWSYLYHRGLSGVGKTNATIDVLPHTSRIREITGPPTSNRPGPIEFGALARTRWYKGHFLGAIHNLLERRNNKEEDREYLL